MKFKKNSIPEPSLGVSFEGVVDELVPNQSMSLKTILQRFTRGEALAVSHEADIQFGDLDGETDLEKLKHADLVDKADFIQRMEEVKQKHAEEVRKAEAKVKADKKAKAEAEFNARVEAEVKKRGGEKSPPAE